MNSERIICKIFGDMTEGDFDFDAEQLAREAQWVLSDPEVCDLPLPFRRTVAITEALAPSWSTRGEQILMQRRLAAVFGLDVPQLPRGETALLKAYFAKHEGVVELIAEYEEKGNDESWQD